MKRVFVMPNERIKSGDMGGKQKKPDSPFGDLSKLFSGGEGSFGKPDSIKGSVEESKLVYSTDAKVNEAANQKGSNRATDAVPVKFSPILRIEKSGRGGKTVTVIDALPRNEDFLAEWTTKLKKLCGSGGTHRVTVEAGIVEVQGDHRDRLRKYFESEGYRVRG